jgi:hypothetical protein
MGYFGYIRVLARTANAMEDADGFTDAVRWMLMAEEVDAVTAGACEKTQRAAELRMLREEYLMSEQDLAVCRHWKTVHACYFEKGLLRDVIAGKRTSTLRMCRLVNWRAIAMCTHQLWRRVIPKGTPLPAFLYICEVKGGNAVRVRVSVHTQRRLCPEDDGSLLAQHSDDLQRGGPVRQWKYEISFTNVTTRMMPLAFVRRRWDSNWDPRDSTPCTSTQTQGAFCIHRMPPFC